MAIDTAPKRRSVLNMNAASVPVILFAPDGSNASKEQRQHLVKMGNAVLFGGGVVGISIPVVMWHLRIQGIS